MGEPFYREAVRVKERRHIILTTDAQLHLLAKAKTWYIDGTLSVLKAPFTQLLSIHVWRQHETGSPLFRADVWEETTGLQKGVPGGCQSTRRTARRDVGHRLRSRYLEGST